MQSKNNNLIKQNNDSHIIRQNDEDDMAIII